MATKTETLSSAPTDAPETKAGSAATAGTSAAATNTPGEGETPGAGEPATGCDLSASHPSDLFRPSGAVGVSFAELDAERVIAECTLALEQDPDNPRYQFQLARGLRKASRHEEARDYYGKAAAQGFAIAQKTLFAVYPEAKAGASSN